MNPVDRSLRILHLEDSRADAELVEFTLEREGVHFSITRVESRSDFIDTLNKGGIDLIISDFTLPAFNGSHALEIARELSPEIPYIFVSGTIGEEAAIDGMRQGATDYVLKSRLSGLVPAIRRAVREAEERKKRKEAEEETLRQKVYFQQLFENAPVAIVMLDDRGGVLRVNSSFERMFQFAGEEALGRLLDDLIVPREQLREARKLQRSSLRKKISSLETVRMRKDGSRVPVNIHTVPLEVEGHRAGVYAIYEDITRRKRAEEDAFRSQRIESIGSLAGGIAHDLNNVLAPILLAIEILKRRVADERAIQILDTLESSARRGSNMVRQILTFARGAGSEHITLEIRHLLTEMEKIFQETFPKSIRLRMEIGKDLRTLTGDGTQIHQVLLNLGVNARDAMPGGGVLTVLAENALVDHRYARLNPGAKAGEYVMVGVGDTGVGMTAEVKEKIFEPFFTTKEPGHGTGLGLSTVHAIVRNHAGFMNIHSEPGKGTMVKVFFPATGNAGQKKVKSRLSALPAGRGELVLVVDDEASIREITRETLESYGYRVAVAADGEAALAEYALHRGDISVVLTDIMMPGVDGPTAIRELKKLDPHLKVIAASGLAPEGQMPHTGGLEVEAFLSKPYTAERLLEALDAVLARRR